MQKITTTKPMEYRVSRVDKGHYECYYKGHLFSVYMVEQSVVFLDDKGSKQLWMCKINEKRTPVWADTKTAVIESVIKHIDNDNTRRRTRVLRMASDPSGQDHINTVEESDVQGQPIPR